MTLILDLGNGSVRVRRGYVQIHMATKYYWNPSNGSNVIAIAKCYGQTDARTDEGIIGWFASTRFTNGITYLSALWNFSTGLW